MKTFDLAKAKNDDEVLCDLCIKTIELKTTKTQKLYIESSAFNKDFSINFKIWDATLELFENMKEIKYVRVKGKINEYLGTKQIIVSSYKEIPESKVNLSDFVVSTVIEKQQIVDYFNEIINKIHNENYIKLITHFIKDDFYLMGASTTHHNKMGGLVEQTYQMLKKAENLFVDDITDLYVNVDTDLLYTGIFLHDIGKLKEYIYDDCGIISEKTTDGKLLGHIELALIDIASYCQESGIEIDDDIKLLLHTIISHHGYIEYGSIKSPMIIEAQIIFQLDYETSHIDTFNSVLNTTENKEFSNRQFTMDNRQIYKH